MRQQNMISTIYLGQLAPFGAHGQPMDEADAAADDQRRRQCNYLRTEPPGPLAVHKQSAKPPPDLRLGLIQAHDHPRPQMRRRIEHFHLPEHAGGDGHFFLNSGALRAACQMVLDQPRLSRIQLMIQPSRDLFLRRVTFHWSSPSCRARFPRTCPVLPVLRYAHDKCPFSPIRASALRRRLYLDNSFPESQPG